MGKTCAVCKQPIENELDEIDVNGNVVHRGVCQKYASQMPLSESGDCDLTETELLL